MKTLPAIPILIALCASLSFAQAIGNDTGYTTPDQVVTCGAYFDQASSPQIQGDCNYAKHVTGGIYSASSVRLTSLQIQKIAGQTLPSVQVQSQTETAICTYIVSVLGFAVSTCAGAGIAAAGGQAAGVSASGTVVGLKSAKWKDVVWGFEAGPSYSAIAHNAPSWFFGLRIGWGR